MISDTAANVSDPRSKRIAVFLHVRRALATGVVAGKSFPEIATTVALDTTFS
jgi:hypothetical protein